MVFTRSVIPFTRLPLLLDNNTFRYNINGIVIHFWVFKSSARLILVDVLRRSFKHKFLTIYNVRIEHIES